MDKDDWDVIKSVFGIAIVATILWFMWRGYVIEMHKYEPDNYNWPDELFGIVPPKER